MKSIPFSTKQLKLLRLLTIVMILLELKIIIIIISYLQSLTLTIRLYFRINSINEIFIINSLLDYIKSMVNVVFSGLNSESEIFTRGCCFINENSKQVFRVVFKLHFYLGDFRFKLFGNLKMDHDFLFFNFH